MMIAEPSPSVEAAAEAVVLDHESDERLQALKSQEPGLSNPSFVGPVRQNDQILENQTMGLNDSDIELRGEGNKQDNGSQVMGKHFRFIYDGNGELVETINTKATSAWQVRTHGQAHETGYQLDHRGGASGGGRS